MIRYTFLLWFLLLMGNATVSACRCKYMPSVAENLNGADAVFSGEIVSYNRHVKLDKLGLVFAGDSARYPYHDELFFLAIQIKIDKKFKGDFAANTVTVLTYPNGAGCGYVHFRLGQKYTIYASNEILFMYPFREKIEPKESDRKIFWTYQCSRTDYWRIEEEEALEEVTSKS